MSHSDAVQTYMELLKQFVQHDPESQEYEYIGDKLDMLWYNFTRKELELANQLSKDFSKTLKG